MLGGAIISERCTWYHRANVPMPSVQPALVKTMLGEMRELQNPRSSDSGVAYVHADASMPNVYRVMTYYIAIIRVCGVRKDAVVAMK
jgi:hypothetical protein